MDEFEFVDGICYLISRGEDLSFSRGDASVRLERTVSRSGHEVKAGASPTFSTPNAVSFSVDTLPRILRQYG